MNTMTIEQAYAVFNSLVQQATGNTALSATDTSSFVSVANTALLTGTDPIMGALSQTLSRTLFAYRPFTARFRGIQKSELEYGNHVRKVNFLYSDLETNQAYELTDGQSVDPWKVKKPQVVQTNYYGQSTFSDFVTIFDRQLDVSLSGPEEFASFLSAVIGTMTNKLELARDSISRASVVNFIGGKTLNDAGNCIKLLTEYNALTGLSLTAQEIMAPENIGAFSRWLVGRIRTLCDMLTENSTIYHQQINGKAIPRQTSYSDLKAYLYTGFLNQFEAAVLGDIFHDKYMKLVDHERVGYWQSIQDPMAINVTPAVLDSNGTSSTGDAVNKPAVLGVLFDKDAIGVNFHESKVRNSPYNQEGEYYNMSFKELHRWYNDFSENGIVLLME